MFEYTIYGHCECGEIGVAYGVQNDDKEPDITICPTCEKDLIVDYAKLETIDNGID
jgi:hypothetical protein